MHNAPAVTYPVGRSSIQGALGLVLWLLGVAATTAWALTSPDARLVSAAACLCTAAAMKRTKCLQEFMEFLSQKLLS